MIGGLLNLPVGGYWSSPPQIGGLASGQSVVSESSDIRYIQDGSTFEYYG